MQCLRNVNACRFDSLVLLQGPSQILDRIGKLQWPKAAADLYLVRPQPKRMGWPCGWGRWTSGRIG
jgi:hypothetical protein